MIGKLFEILKLNISLIELCLRNSNISYIVAEKFAEALKINEILTGLYLPNIINENISNEIF